MDDVVLSRTELYQRIWSKPMRDNASDLGMSDVGLRKLCRREGIPVPPQGYWLMAAGPARDRLKEELPAPGPGDHRSFRFRPKEKVVADAVNEAREAAMDALRASEVSANHTSLAARLVRNMRKALDLRKRDERGILMPQGELPVPIRVSPTQLERALAALERLAARFTAVGIAIEQHDRHSGLLTFDVKGQKYSFWVEETSVRSERALTAKELKERREAEVRGGYFYYADRWQFAPSGKLSIRLSHSCSDYVHRQWADTASAGIEDRIDVVVADTFAFAEKELTEERQREIERRKSRARELWRLRQLRRERHNAQKIRELKWQARSWSRAQMLRGYIDAVDSSDVLTLPAFRDAGEKSAWIAWGRSVVEALDPIANGSAGRQPKRPALEETERRARG